MAEQPISEHVPRTGCLPVPSPPASALVCMAPQLESPPARWSASPGWHCSRPAGPRHTPPAGMTSRSEAAGRDGEGCQASGVVGLQGRGILLLQAAADGSRRRRVAAADPQRLIHICMHRWEVLVGRGRCSGLLTAQIGAATTVCALAACLPGVAVLDPGGVGIGDGQPGLAVALLGGGAEWDAPRGQRAVRGTSAGVQQGAEATPHPGGRSPRSPPRPAAGTRR